jgi:outer membrane immunogenic protein
MTTKMKAAVSLGFAALAAGSAMAADLPVKAKLPPPPAFSWTGCYIGGHFGSLFSEDNWTTTSANWNLAAPGTAAGTSISIFDSTYLVLGGQAGCNYQIGSWVLGVQGDGAYTNASGTATDQVATLLGGLTDQTKIKSIASATGRVGYALDRWLPYVKGGGAWSTVDYNTFVTATNATVSTASAMRSGWTAGGGIEYTIVANLSIFIEYDWYDFGTKSVAFNSSVAGLSSSADIKERDSVVKMGLNWTFR